MNIIKIYEQKSGNVYIALMGFFSVIYGHRKKHKKPYELQFCIYGNVLRGAI